MPAQSVSGIFPAGCLNLLKIPPTDFANRTSLHGEFSCKQMSFFDSRGGSKLLSTVVLRNVHLRWCTTAVVIEAAFG